MTMQSLPRLFDGDFVGKIIGAEYGTGTNGKPSARVILEIAEGPRSGTRVTYEANFKKESIKYTKRNLMAAGWQGKSMDTLASDVGERGGYTVPFRIRIAEYLVPGTGKLRQWNSVDSIGDFVPALSTATMEMTKDVDSWFAAVDDDAAIGNGRRGNDDDLPF